MSNLIKTLEDEIKAVERVNQYTVIRVDGSNFTALTKNMDKFDELFTDSMIQAAQNTADFIGAKEFFVGSDEASFFLDAANSKDGSLQFGGRKDKLLSLSAARMTSVFSQAFQADAIFDARIFTSDSPFWSEMLESRRTSVTRNAINTAAWVLFGDKKMRGVSTDRKRELIAEAGFVIPERELKGTIGRKVEVQRELTEDERYRIPPKYRMEKGTLVTRKEWVLEN